MAAKKKKSSAPGKKRPAAPAKKKAKPESVEAAEEKEHVVQPEEEEKLTISDDSIITLSELSKPLGEKETMADIAPRKQPREEAIPEPEPEPLKEEAPPEKAVSKRRRKSKKAKLRQEGPEEILTEEQLAVLDGAPSPTKAEGVEKALLEPKRKPLAPPPAPPRVFPAPVEKKPRVSPFKRLREKIAPSEAPPLEVEPTALEAEGGLVGVKPTEVTKGLPSEEKSSLEALKDAVLGKGKHRPEEGPAEKPKPKKKRDEDLPPPLPVGGPEEPSPEEREKERKKQERLKRKAEKELKRLVKEKGYVSAKKAKGLKQEIEDLEKKLKAAKEEPMPTPPEAPEPEEQPESLLERVVHIIKHEHTPEELEEEARLEEEAKKEAKKLVKKTGYIGQKEAEALKRKAAELKEKLRAAEEERLAKLQEAEEKRAARLRAVEVRKAAKLRAREERKAAKLRAAKEKAVKCKKKLKKEKMPAPPLPEPEDAVLPKIGKEERPRKALKDAVLALIKKPEPEGPERIEGLLKNLREGREDRLKKKTKKDIPPVPLAEEEIPHKALKDAVLGLIKKPELPEKIEKKIPSRPIPEEPAPALKKEKKRKVPPLSVREHPHRDFKETVTLLSEVLRPSSWKALKGEEEKIPEKVEKPPKKKKPKKENIPVPPLPEREEMLPPEIKKEGLPHKSLKEAILGLVKHEPEPGKLEKVPSAEKTLPRKAKKKKPKPKKKDILPVPLPEEEIPHKSLKDTVLGLIKMPEPELPEKIEAKILPPPPREVPAPALKKEKKPLKEKKAEKKPKKEDKPEFPQLPVEEHPHRSIKETVTILSEVLHPSSWKALTGEEEEIPETEEKPPQKKKLKKEEIPAPPLPEPEEMQFPEIEKIKERKGPSLPPPPLPEEAVSPEELKDTILGAVKKPKQEEKPTKTKKPKKKEEMFPPPPLPEGEAVEPGPTESIPGVTIPDEAKPEHLKRIESLWDESEKLWKELHAVPEEDKDIMAALDKAFVKVPRKKMERARTKVPEDVISEEQDIMLIQSAKVADEVGRGVAKDIRKLPEAEKELKKEEKKPATSEPEKLKEEIASVKKAVTEAAPAPPEAPKPGTLPKVPEPEPMPQAPQPAEEKPVEMPPDDLELPPPPEQSEVALPALFDVPDMAPPSRAPYRKEPKEIPKVEESRDVKELRLRRLASEFKELDQKLEGISSKLAETKKKEGKRRPKRPEPTPKKSAKELRALKAKKREEELEAEKARKKQFEEEQRQHEEELRERIEELAQDMRRLLTSGQLDAAEEALARIRRHCQQIGKKSSLGPLEYELTILEADLKLARLG